MQKIVQMVGHFSDQMILQNLALARLKQALPHGDLIVQPLAQLFNASFLRIVRHRGNEHISRPHTRRPAILREQGIGYLLKMRANLVLMTFPHGV